MYIFLCGERGVGKSTLIQKSLLQLQIEPSGFVTITGPDDRRQVSEVYIMDAHAAKRGPCTAANRVGRRYADGMWRAFPEVFDKAGVALLAQAGPPLILMDELGFMEKDAAAFQAEVLRLLNGDIPVVGVIKPLPLPFLQQIRSHPRVSVLDITRRNREQQLPHLTSLLERQLNKR